MSASPSFLNNPDRTGAFGALMGETARAAEEFCRRIESISAEEFRAVHPSDDPDTASIRSICIHAVGAAHRYADYIRQARGLPYVDRFQVDPDRLQAPADVRPLLIEALQYTEGAIESFPDDEVAGLTFQVRWGPTYDTEMILEHGIVHLLRHRRQIDRWKGVPRSE
jgi:hypothetical protein